MEEPCYFYYRPAEDTRNSYVNIYNFCEIEADDYLKKEASIFFE